MERQKLMTLAYWIMIAFVVVTCICVIWYLMSNAHSCLADPVTYYEEKMHDECYCMNNVRVVTNINKVEVTHNPLPFG